MFEWVNKMDPVLTGPMPLLLPSIWCQIKLKALTMSNQNHPLCLTFA